MSYFVFFCWLFICKHRVDQLPRLGKRELICLLLFTCNYVISVGEVSSSSGCFGWATLFYCGTPSALHIIILISSLKDGLLRQNNKQNFVRGLLEELLQSLF